MASVIPTQHGPSQVLRLTPGALYLAALSFPSAAPTSPAPHAGLFVASTEEAGYLMPAPARGTWAYECEYRELRDAKKEKELGTILGLVRVHTTPVLGHLHVHDVVQHVAVSEENEGTGERAVALDWSLRALLELDNVGVIKMGRDEETKKRLAAEWEGVAGAHSTAATGEFPPIVVSQVCA